MIFFHIVAGSNAITQAWMRVGREIKAYLELAKFPNVKVIIIGKGNTTVILDAKN